MTNTLRIFFLSWLIAAPCCQPSVYAQSGRDATINSFEGAKILQVSTSKKSLILDKGIVEGLRNGERCKFYVKDLSDGLMNPQLHYVAEGELVKVTNRESYWFLRKIERYQDLVGGGVISLVRQSRDPRRPFVARRTLKVKGRAGTQDYYAVSEDTGVPDDLVFEEQDFFSSDELVKTKPTRKENLEISKRADYIEFGKEYDENYQQERKRLMYPSDEGDEKLVKRIKEKADTRVWQSTVRPSVEKYNKLKYGLKGLYADVETDPRSNVRKKSNTVTIAQEAEYKAKMRQGISPEIKERIKREGARWSQDMSDAEMREYLITTGVEEEIRRQKFVLNDRPGHELILRYGSAFTTQTTADDPSHQSADYSIGLAYEWHLKGTAVQLDNWSLEVGLERGISHFDVGGFNARIVEGSVKVLANYYLWHPPSSIRKYMPYVGLGIKRGNGTLESFSINNSYTYQLMAVPTAQLGIKYRFQSGDAADEDSPFGLGLNFQLVYEALRYNSEEDVVEDMDTVLTANTLKFTVGINMYF